MSKIEGPFGIWTFPFLNALVAMANASDEEDSNAKIYNVIRDNEGNIDRIMVEDATETEQIRSILKDG